MKPTIYIETTIPSYYASKPSRDIIVLAHQEITRMWWDERLQLFEAYISPVVIEEAGRGNEEQAYKRLNLLSQFRILKATDEIEQLTETYMKKIGLPSKAIRDSAHLAFASAYGLDYLITWNCAHIANAEFRRRLWDVNLSIGIRTPIICTPEELLGKEFKNVE
jgi:predicted nucleic acid-binding protein